MVNNFEKDIPKGWDLLKLGEILDVKHGKNQKDVEDNNGDYPIFGTGGQIGNARAYLLDKPSVLIGRKGTIDKPRYIEQGFWTVDTLFYTVINERNNPKFVYYKFCMIPWKKYNEATGVPSLSASTIKSIKVLLPPLNEQEKIASILSTWDKAIQLKEKLIQQKKQQKKGLMQKLLTGEKRLPGFEGEWEEVKLGDILKERKETGYTGLELLAITSTKGVIKRSELESKDNSSEDKSKYKRILPNDIGYNTMRMWQGVSGVSSYEGIVSPAYTVLKPTPRIAPNFIGYLFKHPKIINLFKRYSQGLVNDTLNLKYVNFKVIKVKIPVDLSEQKAIAQTLITIDENIRVLEENITQLKQQKKGLMQLLLTGKVRVKV
ncbi:restriction endonuclease subunit S [Proteinivorax hydrogeniformans]|uniref:Restriction endonuclease subunit S n=1 Tax=Proteinivorax hydrogeniformans TaxID=1826727 RepID=A0AAU8HUD9_9FIRM